MSEKYIVRSNRESGFGRYDIMIYPKDIAKETIVQETIVQRTIAQSEVTNSAITDRDGIIIEFKVRNKRKEANLEQTVEAALRQIEEKNYAAELKVLGFREENIRKYGFAFEGKNVLIGE